ncbi:MAG: ABC transporter permease [Actinomycetota bacterium]|nr:ABC transporter permease [Actinomycetota bacterium]
MNPLTFIARRLGAAVVILVILVAAMFTLSHLSHTDPAHAYLGAGASKSAVAAERAKLGLNLPITTQFFHYVGNLLHGNLGVSYRTRNPVTQDLAEYLPATMELAFYALLLALLLGLMLGVASAGHWRGARILKFVMVSGASAPLFLLALLGILIFYGHLGWLPASGRTSMPNPPTGPTGFLTLDALLAGRFNMLINALEHLLMPATVLAIGPAVSIGRVLRGSLVTVLREDYIRTARSKGLRERAVLLRHALRNSVGPALSMTGLQAGLLLAGDVVVEQVFAWPGIGYYAAQSIPVGDFPAISGVTLVLGLGYVLINALVDILQRLADPRVRI